MDIQGAIGGARKAQLNLGCWTGGDWNPNIQNYLDLKAHQVAPNVWCRVHTEKYICCWRYINKTKLSSQSHHFFICFSLFPPPLFILHQLCFFPTLLPFDYFLKFPLHSSVLFFSLDILSLPVLKTKTFWPWKTLLNIIWSPQTMLDPTSIAGSLFWILMNIEKQVHIHAHNSVHDQ